jgi:hypothetical protein
MTMKKLIKFLLMLCMIGFLVSCNNNEDMNSAGLMIRVSGINAHSTNGDTGPIMYSDVWFDKSYINDVAEVEIATDLLNQTIPPSFFNSVLLTRYRVTYKRPDNRNVPGVDVPYPFDEVMNLEISANGRGSTTITIVRAIAKDEAPLVWLAEAGNSEKIISGQAHIEIWGHDLAGRTVYCKGYLEVLFADWAD